MIRRLGQWAEGRRSRPALLVRTLLERSEPGDPELRTALASTLTSAPCAPDIVALGWRAIELMDLGGAVDDRIAGLIDALGAPPLPQLPLLLPTGAIIVDPDAANLAGEALALRALTKAHHQNDPLVRRRLDELARRGPGMDGPTRRASALHGIAADAVHYPTAATKLVQALAAAQRSDGSWGEHDLFHLGQALLAVEHPEATRALQRGAEALGGRQGPDGGFGSEERSWIACRWLRRVGG